MIIGEMQEMEHSIVFKSFSAFIIHFPKCGISSLFILSFLLH